MNGDGITPPKRIGQIFDQAAAEEAEFPIDSLSLGAMARRASHCPG
jgi:hypothetical protein